MIIEGKYHKSGKWWIADIPALDAGTQATQREDLSKMVSDLIASLLDLPPRSKFTAKIELHPDETFTIETNHDDDVFCLILARQRTKNHLSQKDVAKLLGYSSTNAYSAYEQGKRRPSLEKAAKLLGAVTGKKKLRLKVG